MLDAPKLLRNKLEEIAVFHNLNSFETESRQVMQIEIAIEAGCKMVRGKMGQTAERCSCLLYTSRCV